MLDTLLKFGSMFDWITPTLAFIQDICNGPSVQIACPYDQGWSGRQIKRLLRGYGVKVWGLMVVGELITFTVRKAQARYALYWLQRHGLQYQSSIGEAAQQPPSPPADRRAAGRRKPARGIDGLVDGIASFVDGL